MDIHNKTRGWLIRATRGSEDYKACVVCGQPFIPDTARQVRCKRVHANRPPKGLLIEERRMAERVCIECGGKLSPSSGLLCFRHLLKENQRARKDRS